MKFDLGLVAEILQKYGDDRFPDRLGGWYLNSDPSGSISLVNDLDEVEICCTPDWECDELPKHVIVLEISRGPERLYGLMLTFAGGPQSWRERMCEFLNMVTVFGRLEPKPQDTPAILIEVKNGVVKRLS
jgi:hypothetical protein